MYIPGWSREERLDVLHEVMRQHAFATLVSVYEGIPVATHLPFLLDATRGDYGVLRAHMARANSQWQHITDGQETLTIFQGPHTYISPSWYATEPNVPTWNYVAIHAYGTPRLLDDAETLDALRALVTQYEGDDPIRQARAMPPEHTERIARGLVAFEIPIARLEGRFKMSQNKPEADRQGVLDALEQTEAPDNRAVADWMRRLNV